MSGAVSVKRGNSNWTIKCKINDFMATAMAQFNNIGSVYESK
jgi:hypothetical protein